nr:hypothetical protein [Flavipsychrobacter stenotrophus]
MNKLKLAAAIVGFGILGVTMSQAAFPIHEKARQETTSATNANGNNEQLSQADAQYSSASATSQSAPAAPKSHGGKSQLVALLLVIFLGGFRYSQVLPWLHMAGCCSAAYSRWLWCMGFDRSYPHYHRRSGS